MKKYSKTLLLSLILLIDLTITSFAQEYKDLQGSWIVDSANIDAPPNFPRNDRQDIEKGYILTFNSDQSLHLKTSEGDDPAGKFSIGKTDKIAFINFYIHQDEITSKFEIVKLDQKKMWLKSDYGFMKFWIYMTRIEK